MAIEFARHLSEYVVCLEPKEPLTLERRGRDIPIVRVNITYRFYPEVVVWKWHRALAYGLANSGERDEYGTTFRWYPASNTERVPSWLPDLVAKYAPKEN